MVEQKQAAQQDNFGFYKIERLPGNIGYLDIRYFYRPAWGGEVATAAMNMVSRIHFVLSPQVLFVFCLSTILT